MDQNTIINKNENKHRIPSFGKICILALIILIVTIVASRYIADEDFRQSFDANVLRKELTSEDLNTIEINSEYNPTIVALNNNIAVLSKSVLNIYNASGKVINSLNINLYSPLKANNGNYLALAENNGSRLYLIKNSALAWQTKVDGTISRINVNNNGYVSVIVTNTTYKSVVILFDSNGEELFKTYLSHTYAICSDLSPDNRFLAIGEVDYSGTIIKSYVRIISTEKVTSDAENSTVNRYESESGEVITNIKYADKQNAVCMFTSYIQNITPTGDNRLFDINNDTIFADINNNSTITLVEKQSSGLFSYDYQMRTINVLNNSNSLFILSNSMPKTIDCVSNKVCINYGNEIQITNIKGWLLKRYTPHSEIKQIIIGENIAGIIYKDEIDIISI